MPISIACGDCGSKYKVQDALAGKKVKCKKCGDLIVIPTLVPAAVEGEAKPVARVPRPSVRPSPVSRPAAPRPAAAPRPVAKRPAPPPPEPVSVDAAFDDSNDLADLADLPTAPAYTPRAVAAPAPARAMAIGYATPRNVGFEQPAYIQKYGNALRMASYLVPLAGVVLVGVMATIQMGTLNPMLIGMLLVGAAIGVAIILGFVVPLMLGGVKIAAAIMKFEVTDGYKHMMMVVGGVSILRLVMQFIGQALAGTPEVAVVLAIIGLLGSLALTAKLIKDVYVLNWAQTALSTVLSVLCLFAGIIGIVVVIALFIGSATGVLQQLVR